MKAYRHVVEYHIDGPKCFVDLISVLGMFECEQLELVDSHSYEITANVDVFWKHKRNVLFTLLLAAIVNADGQTPQLMGLIVNGLSFAILGVDEDFFQHIPKQFFVLYLQELDHLVFFAILVMVVFVIHNKLVVCQGHVLDHFLRLVVPKFISFEFR